jgi:hypothetical protein
VRVIATGGKTASPRHVLHEEEIDKRSKQMCNQVCEDNQLLYRQSHLYTDSNHWLYPFDYIRGPAHGRMNVRGF